MAISFLKPLERIIRTLLIGSGSPFKGQIISSISDAIQLPHSPRILIIRPDKLGDMLITLPTIKAIRDAYPTAHIDILAGKVNLPLRSQLLHYVDDCLLYDKTLRSIFGLYRTLPKRQYDIAVDPMDNPSTTSGFLIRMSKAKHMVGIQKSNAHVYTHCVVPKDRKQTHIVERTAQVLLAFGINPKEISLSIPYHLDDALIETSKHALLRAGVNLSKPLIMINYAGGFQYRSFTAESLIPWIRSIQQVVESKDIQLMICAEKKHEDDMRSIQEATSILIAPFVHSFADFAGILAAASMVLSPDTSVVHLLSAFHTPCLAFFVEDTTGTAYWTPYDSPNECIISGGPTINDVSQEMVLKSFLSLFKSTRFFPIDEQYQRLQG